MAKNNSTPNLTQLPLMLEGATVSILLNKGFVTIVDAIDADLFEKFTWSAYKSKSNFYIKRGSTIKNKDKSYFLHKVILGRKLGRELLAQEKADHIDCDTFNNRRENLRLATNTENSRNKRLSRNNKSGFKGVYSSGKKWKARIMVDGRTIYLGSHLTPEEAHKAYCEAAVKYFGEFARFK